MLEVDVLHDVEVELQTSQFYFKEKSKYEINGNKVYTHAMTLVKEKA